jgi:hypothetical protein
MTSASTSILAQPAPPETGHVKEEHIRQRAYDLFEQRGGRERARASGLAASRSGTRDHLRVEDGPLWDYQEADLPTSFRSEFPIIQSDLHHHP